MSSFFKDLMKCVKVLKTERDKRAANMLLKVEVGRDVLGHTLQRYYDHLTPYAFKMLQREMQLSEKVMVKKVWKKKLWRLKVIIMGAVSLSALTSAGVAFSPQCLFLVATCSLQNDTSKKTNMTNDFAKVVDKSLLHVIAQTVERFER